MEVTVNIKSNNQPLKQLTESHDSTIPSLISALGRIKESTNNYLTEVINNGSKDDSGTGDACEMEDEDENGGNEDKPPARNETDDMKRKSSGRQNRKRRKT